MSDDLDFDMEVVEDDELDEMGGGGASSSGKHMRPQREDKGGSETDEIEGKVEEPSPSNPEKGSEGIDSTRTSENYQADAGATQLERDAFGNLPADWEYFETGDGLEYIRSGISESQNQDGEGIPVTRIETISDGTVNYEKVGYVAVNPNEAKADRMQSGDLLFSNINSREQIGKTAIYKREKPLYHGMNLLRLRYQGDVLQPLFAYYLYDSPMAKDVFFRLAQAAVGQSSINQGQLRNLSLPRPPLPEQRKIASVLYAVDRAIQKTEEILDRLRRLRRKYIDEVCKSGYYEHQEKQSVRVGPREVKIPTNWRFLKLESLTSLITKGQTPTSHGFEYQQNGINFVKAESIDEDGRLIKDKFAHIGREADEKLSRSRLEQGDVLFSIAGALGKVAQVKEQFLPANINQALALIRCDDEGVDESFIRYYLESKTIRKYIQSISTVTAQPNLSLKQVSEFDVFLPPLEEQRLISKACAHFDAGIENEENQLCRLRRLKRGLMQDLLTGEVRTAERAIEVLEEVRAHG